ncbi:lantibiotic dehydratase [Geothrix sp. 21YS21S-2]|uniref:lantibiotic dehydratase n=1 Tax=Geothrix sp. 21YS21S-2 TaxID=3068893 RepID=UPI0027BA674C|nr:lantibiotic dehydratase [Geothrix sp. 21YS21S-2]
MRPPALCHASTRFLLRSPALPLEVLQAWAQDGPSSGDGEEAREALRRRMRSSLEKNAVLEALAVASPDLSSRIQAWADGGLRGKEARNLDHGLVKYLARMASRCTPFGLFASVSLGGWGDGNSLALGPWEEARRHARLDWGVVGRLQALLEDMPQAVASASYRPNTTLHPFGGWYRYLKVSHEGGRGAAYHLEAVEQTRPLRWVIDRSGTGARLGELAGELARFMGTREDEARAYLDLLAESQVLAGDLQPPLTQGDPIDRLLERSGEGPRPGPWKAALEAVRNGIGELGRTPVGSHPEGYRQVVAPLEELGLPDLQDPLQVDVFRPAPGLMLSGAVRAALEAGIETLRRVTPARTGGPMARFRSAFRERYGDRWVPLLEVLDEESGIGFDGEVPVASPLLEGLGIPTGEGPSPPPYPERDRFLAGRLQRLDGARVLDLGPEDLDALAPGDLPALPASFAAMAVLAASSMDALDGGDFQFFMEGYSGPSSARLLGRFAPGEPGLEAALVEDLRREEALRPDAVFAEVVHNPGGRLGNVLVRPRLRPFEIPVLATPGVPWSHAILLSDLRVRVVSDRAVLASARLGKEVIPRLSTAHNFRLGPPAYRFLAHLQDQECPPGGWSWGTLADLPFLPRVTCGRHVLSKARWRLSGPELRAALAGASRSACEAFGRLRRQRGLPRHVVLADADNALPFDLDQELWVETLCHLVAGREAFTLTECFPPFGQGLASAPEGTFAHELVVPFESEPPPPPSPARLLQSLEAPQVRSFLPGSEWLFLKVYCGHAAADRILAELAPAFRAAKEEGWWDQWFFLRYGDPGDHLRLRFHGAPGLLLGVWLPRLSEHLERLRGQGLLWKVQVDTYEPEQARYGGPEGLRLAEAWFHEDSQAVLDSILAGDDHATRWQRGLAEVDRIWTGLGLDLQARKALAVNSRIAFRKEFGDPGAAGTGKTFRRFREALETRVPAPEGPAADPVSPALLALREAGARGQLQGTIQDLASSLSHMHLNRLLRSHQRAQEWVLMEFLARLYDSAQAKERHRGERKGLGAALRLPGSPDPD